MSEPGALAPGSHRFAVSFIALVAEGEVFYAGAMSRALRYLLIVVALLASACGSDIAETDSGATEPGTGVGAPAIEESTTTTTPPPPPPPGREVIAAAEAAGEPYVLWFWGVN